MTWWQKLLQFFADLFTQTPPVPPVVPPPDPGGPPDPAGVRFPSGNIKTRGPNGRSLAHIPWSQISRWEPRFTQAAAKEGRGKFSPLLLACFVVIESEGQHYITGQMSGRREDVLRGHGDARSIGITQVRTDLHDPRELFRPFEPEGNIRLGATLLADWMDQVGPWEEVIRLKWHPGTDPVSQTTIAEYIRTVRDLIAEVKASWTTPAPSPTPQPSEGTTYSVAGLTTKITLPFPLHVDLIPPSQTNQRPGIRMIPDRWIQHETGNPRPGANAHMHRNYLFSGAEGQKLSYHFTVDDHEAWQMIPVNEVAWHGGDGSGVCNMRGVACELCINSDIDTPRSREYAAILAAEVMNAMNLRGIHPHIHCIGTDHHCPDKLLSEGKWDWFAQHVLDLVKGRKR